MRVVWATVREVLGGIEGTQLVRADLDDGTAGEAIGYTALTGVCTEGDRVQLNTTAVELGLGTGGRHFIVAREGAGSGVVLDEPSGGHVMKLRYTPLQLDVVSVEAPESPHHEVMAQAHTLAGLPVVCCGLHSQAPLVAAAVKAAAPRKRVVYCMTDEAALALPLSRVMRESADAGLVDATITCGQSFGGDFEAVNLHSGLLAARHVCDADVAIVAIGPGVVGTATPLGHGGVVQGESINAVAALDGHPVACVRMSFADPRGRHRGVSHHTISALTTVALAPATVALPALPEEISDTIDKQLESAGVWRLHREARSKRDIGWEPSLRGVAVTSMGRGPEQDPIFFHAAYAAGEIASSGAASLL